MTLSACASDALHLHVYSRASLPERPCLCVSCSANGSVVLAKQVEGMVVGRPQHLQCREKHAQCSLAACTINGQVAAGSMEGTITMWDTESGLAKHHLQDEVCAF